MRRRYPTLSPGKGLNDVVSADALESRVADLLCNRERQPHAASDEHKRGQGDLVCLMSYDTLEASTLSCVMSILMLFYGKRPSGCPNNSASARPVSGSSLSALFEIWFEAAEQA